MELITILLALLCLVCLFIMGWAYSHLMNSFKRMSKTYERISIMFDATLRRLNDCLLENQRLKFYAPTPEEEAFFKKATSEDDVFKDKPIVEGDFTEPTKMWTEVNNYQKDLSGNEDDVESED